MTSPIILVFTIISLPVTSELLVQVLVILEQNYNSDFLVLKLAMVFYSLYQGILHFKGIRLQFKVFAGFLRTAKE